MSISSFLTRKFLKNLFFPAHNRGKALPKRLISLLEDKPGIWDLPELAEIGTPLSDKGLVAKAQKDFARKFNCNACWFGVNGASGLIQSALIAVARKGEYILIPRNIHISVIKICILANIKPIFFDLPISEKTGHYSPITPEVLLSIINSSDLSNIKISGIVLVHPHYQGYASDLTSLVEICHRKNIPVIVDEAHGSYFLFCQDIGLPKSAVLSKADLVIQSLHKSLNGLTQTAVLWHKGNLVEKGDVAKSVNLLQTTSPNALLLASCEESIKDCLNKENLINFKKRIFEAKIVFQKLIKKGVPLVKTQDPLKIILNTGSFGINGFFADQYFYDKGIVAELPEMMTLTFCLGFSEHHDFVDMFEKVWNGLLLSVKKREEIMPLKPPFKLVEYPEISPKDAWIGRTIEIPIEDSIGKVSADIICPYPPGIPLIIPGEKIDKIKVEWILEQRLFSPDLFNSYIRVIMT